MGKHLPQLVGKPFVLLWKSIRILVWNINNVEVCNMYQMSNSKFKEREWIAGNKSVSVLYSKVIPFLWSLSQIPTSVSTPFWTGSERGVETLKSLHYSTLCALVQRDQWLPVKITYRSCTVFHWEGRNAEVEPPIRSHPPKSPAPVRCFILHCSRVFPPLHYLPLFFFPDRIKFHIWAEARIWGIKSRKN